MSDLDYTANTPADERVLARFCEVERRCIGSAAPAFGGARPAPPRPPQPSAPGRPHSPAVFFSAHLSERPFPRRTKAAPGRSARCVRGRFPSFLLFADRAAERAALREAPSAQLGMNCRLQSTLPLSPATLPLLVYCQ